MKFVICLILILQCLGFVYSATIPPQKTIVTSLPDFGTLPSPQTTGFLNVANTTANAAYLFYWYVPSLNNPATDPLLIWLSGGPGCSSELSYFYEIGPFRILGSGAASNTTLQFDGYTWARNASLLFIDSPVGTGFSYLANPLGGGYATDEQDVADALYAFLNLWLPLFPNHLSTAMYISAESYGGHYAPALATRINAGNADGNPATLQMHLKGISIGNGMTDPYHQYAAYAPFALGRGLIDGVLYQQLVKQYGVCQQTLDSGDLKAADSECNAIISAITQAGGPFNNYDVTKTCIPGQPLCYDFDPLTTYLNRPDVQQAIGVKEKWSVCSTVAGEFMRSDGDWWSAQNNEVPAFLALGQRVLVYGGTNDFIVNFLGSEAWVRDLVWSGQKAYQNAPRAVWEINNIIAGYALEYGGLSMVAVINAGHMVPYDMPISAYDLFLRMVTNQTFTAPAFLDPLVL